MAIKYDKNIPNIYKSLMRHMGSVQRKILKYITKTDPCRNGIDPYQIYSSINFKEDGFVWRSSRWHDVYSSLKRLFSNRVLCKVILGESAIEMTSLPEEKLKNSAWFLYNPASKIDFRYTIHPDYDMEIIGMIADAKENIIINRLEMIYETGYEI